MEEINYLPLQSAKRLVSGVVWGGEWDGENSGKTGLFWSLIYLKHHSIIAKEDIKSLVAYMSP